MMARLTTTALMTVSLFIGACGQSHRDFVSDREPDLVPPDADVDGGCPRQCSLDFRSIVSSCDGAIIQECPPELACGANGCAPPCDAVASLQSSLGCEFYSQPPQTTVGAGSCYAAYVINAWHEPITLDIALGDETLDLSNAVFRFKPG